MHPTPKGPITRALMQDIASQTETRIQAERIWVTNHIIIACVLTFCFSASLFITLLILISRT